MKRICMDCVLLQTIDTVDMSFMLKAIKDVSLCWFSSLRSIEDNSHALSLLQTSAVLLFFFSTDSFTRASDSEMKICPKWCHSVVSLRANQLPSQCQCSSQPPTPLIRATPALPLLPSPLPAPRDRVCVRLRPPPSLGLFFVFPLRLPLFSSVF